MKTYLTTILFYLILLNIGGLSAQNKEGDNPPEIWAVVLGESSLEGEKREGYSFGNEAFEFYAFLRQLDSSKVNKEHLHLYINHAVETQTVQNILEESSAKADENDIFLIYFEGLNPEAKGGAQISVQDLEEAIHKTRANQKIIVLKNGSLVDKNTDCKLMKETSIKQFLSKNYGSSYSEEKEILDANGALKKLEEPKEQLTAFQLGKEAWERGGYQQAFSLFLLSNLRNEEIRDNNAMLAYCYFTGLGAWKIKLDKSEQYARAAMEEGSALAAVILGKIEEKNGNDQLAQDAYTFAVSQIGQLEQNAVGQAELSFLYYFGLGVNKDLDKALYWSKKSAKSREPQGQYRLGISYDFGDGVEQNYANAVECYEKSAEQGYHGAQYNLAVSYDLGEGVEQNYEAAVDWCRKAAEQGAADAQYSLGLYYDLGEGVEQNYETAVYWYQKAANQGEPDAQYALAVSYDFGEGVEKDQEKAVFWYQKAAKQGDTLAQYNLALCYQNAEGVEQSYEQAFYWYQKAAEQGYLKAQITLASLYDSGEGLKFDRDKAMYWCEKAAQQGDMNAQYLLGIYIWQRADLKTAILWLRKAAEQGHSDAQKSLGNCYYYGWNVEQSYEQAAYWHTAAAEQGNIKSQFILATYYEKGEGVPKDMSKARYWMQKSAEQGESDAKLWLKQNTF